ncbi:MAG TPA: SNF2-related protein, partial [Gemmataceae bacterium]|nr:SNF2-related protein [Gemmataceae bacterium]
MLREEQIDIRRQRAVEGKFRIQNLGRNRVFSDYQVTNPASGGQYTVSIRGFEVGDNKCSCPDFRTNTLGTCKHVEAVLEVLRAETPATLQHRKAAVTRPEVYLHYGEQLQLGVHLPPRHSDQLHALARRFFDEHGFWKADGDYAAFIEATHTVPEQVTIFSDAMEFIEWEIERREMAGRERQWLQELDEGRLQLDLLKEPLYPYQTRGALFAACRGRCILGDDMGLGKCLGPDSPVFANGTLWRAEDLWTQFAGPACGDGEGEWARPLRPLWVNSLTVGDEAEQMVRSPVQRLYRQYIRERVRLIRLEDGNELVVTRRHRLLGRDGWENRLRAGDVVCVPSRLVWDGPEADPDLVTLLAWQIAEGNEPPGRSTVRISQKAVARLQALRCLARRVGDRYGLKMNRMSICQPAGDAPSLVITSVAYRAFLEQRGYHWGQRSAGKRVPDWILSAGPETARTFLRHYFAAEGSVCRRARQVSICSASEWLMRQLSHLLRRFGIWLRLTAKRKRATNGKAIWRTYFEGTLGGNAARRFLQDVGFDDPEKQAALEGLCAVLPNTNVEGVPATDLLVALARVTGLPYRHLAPNTVYFYGTQEFSRASAHATVQAIDRVLSGEAEAAYRRLPRSKWTDATLRAYDRLDRDAAQQCRDRLARLANREVYYTRIAGIREVMYEGWVYDLEVPGHHNFVAGGILCHNTVQTMAAVELLARERNIERVLIVAPSSVKYQWETEIRRFTDRPVQIIDGGAKERRALYAQPTFYRLINYEFVLRDLDELNAWQPDLIVLDEAQRIKNWESKISRAVKKLRSRYALVLTGTPLENKIEELYSIVQFVDDRRLGPA